MKTCRRPKQIASRTMYRGRVITVTRDTIVTTPGRTVQMDVVRHRGSVVLVPQPTRREVILIRQFRYVIGRWIWELPAGSLDPDETPARGARRECAEEVGWHPRTLVRLGVYYPTPGFCDEKLTFYACRDLERPRHTVHHDEDEQIEALTMSVDEAWRMAEDGRIVDLKTLAGLAMVTGRLPVRRSGNRTGATGGRGLKRG